MEDKHFVMLRTSSGVHSYLCTYLRGIKPSIFYLSSTCAIVCSVASGRPLELRTRNIVQDMLRGTSWSVKSQVDVVGGQVEPLT